MLKNNQNQTTFTQAPIIKKHYGSKTAIRAELKTQTETSFEAIPEKKQAATNTALLLIS